MASGPRFISRDPRLVELVSGLPRKSRSQRIYALIEGGLLLEQLQAKALISDRPRLQVAASIADQQFPLAVNLILSAPAGAFAGAATHAPQAVAQHTQRIASVTPPLPPHTGVPSVVAAASGLAVENGSDVAARQLDDRVRQSISERTEETGESAKPEGTELDVSAESLHSRDTHGAPSESHATPLDGRPRRARLDAARFGKIGQQF